jgi:hypothetical protein
MTMNTINRHASALRILVLAAATTVFAGLLPAARAAAQEDLLRPTELIKITNVSLESAFTLAEGVCRSAGQSRVATDEERNPGMPSIVSNCADVRYLEDERMIAVTATPEVIARVRALLAEFDRTPETRAFHIIVLSASSEGAIAADVPQSARAALEDVSDFLPFTGFTVLGTGWIRTSSQGRTTLAGASELIAELAFRPTTDPTAPLLIENFEVYQFKQVSMTVDGNVTTQFMRTGSLETTFTISPGETVVVGTSKLNGDDSAVVVLLTAVQR